MGQFGLSGRFRLGRECLVAFAAAQQGEALALLVDESRACGFAAFLAVSIVLEDVEVGNLFQIVRIFSDPSCDPQHLVSSHICPRMPTKF